MSEFNIYTESVDVDRLMEQIRARIREKRGLDYTEEQIREMAEVKLERVLEPKTLRSDLIEHYRRQQQVGQADEPQPAQKLPPSFEFDPDTIYRSSRGGLGKILHGIRWLLRPVLKLFFNPTPIVHALQIQREINKQIGNTAELNALTYELLNNLVVEMTRLSIDVKNHKMRVESIAGRLDFDERRARALESVVQYRSASDAPAAPGGKDSSDDTPGGAERKRRRRRRGRRRPSVSPPAGDAPAAQSGKSDQRDQPAAGDASAAQSGKSDQRDQPPAGDASAAQSGESGQRDQPAAATNQVPDEAGASAATVTGGADTALSSPNAAEPQSDTRGGDADAHSNDKTKPEP